MPLVDFCLCLIGQDLVPWPSPSCKGVWESKYLCFLSFIEGYRHGRGDWEWLVGFSKPTESTTASKW